MCRSQMAVGENSMGMVKHRLYGVQKQMLHHPHCLPGCALQSSSWPVSWGLLTAGLLARVVVCVDVA